MAAEAPIQLRPELLPVNKAVTLVGAVRLSEKNYPQIAQQQAEVRAAKRNVSLQKIKEYNPNTLMSYQDVVASHNRLTQTLFSSPTLPSTPGPGPESVTMHPKAFSAAGFIIDWAPIDFGLHKARIDQSKAEYQFSQASYGLTLLDVTVAACFSQIKNQQISLRRQSKIQQFLHRR
ncbi:MAG: TolC family protein, partial [Candidatus Obscuribacterales bacterium]|nr:TolC family protein [Candidatus Obscuribacterales bacterium]